MRRLQQGFNKCQSIKTKSYSSTRHRKKKQKKQQEVWFLAGKMSPRAKGSHYCSPFPTAQFSEESAPPSSAGDRYSLGVLLLHGHLHKAEEESPAEAQGTPNSPSAWAVGTLLFPCAQALHSELLFLGLLPQCSPMLPRTQFLTRLVGHGLPLYYQWSTSKNFLKTHFFTDLTLPYWIIFAYI